MARYDLWSEGHGGVSKETVMLLVLPRNAQSFEYKIIDYRKTGGYYDLESFFGQTEHFPCNQKLKLKAGSLVKINIYNLIDRGYSYANDKVIFYEPDALSYRYDENGCVAKDMVRREAEFKDGIFIDIANVQTFKPESRLHLLIGALRSPIAYGKEAERTFEFVHKGLMQIAENKPDALIKLAKVREEFFAGLEKLNLEKTDKLPYKIREAEERYMFETSQACENALGLKTAYRYCIWQDKKDKTKKTAKSGCNYDDDPAFTYAKSKVKKWEKDNNKPLLGQARDKLMGRCIKSYKNTHLGLIKGK